MALSERDAIATAKDLDRVRQKECDERLDKIHQYMRGKACNIYVPQAATREYRLLVDQSSTNVLPLVVTAVAQNLFADGYRPAKASKDAAAWEIWQANRMDARQAGLYRAALTYGVSYAMVLPGKPQPVITPYSPRQLTAVYEDPINDEWPVYALATRVAYEDRKPVKRLRLLDETNVYDLSGSADGGTLRLTKSSEHGLSVCPVPRWLNEYGDIDDGAQGEVEPLIPLQDQLRQTTFGLLMAQQYAAFRQRWVTGMAIDEDENGVPREPWNSAVNRVWHAESTDTRFGDFAETSLDGYLASRRATLTIMSAIAQIPPNAFLISESSISNLSADALAAVESSLQRKVGERKTSFGESDEQMLRLSALANKDSSGWEDTSAQIVWRDTESRSLAQVADALGKMAQMLQVPPRALWERLPGVTKQDLDRWQQIADEDGGMQELNAMLRSSIEPRGVPGNAGRGREPANAPA